MTPPPITTALARSGITGAITSGSCQAATAEPVVEDDARHEQAADAEQPEHRLGVDLAHEPAEVLAEEAGHEGEREEDGRDDRQLLDDLVLLRRDPVLADARHREVRLERVR